jgi:hypothetical protein
VRLNTAGAGDEHLGAERLSPRTPGRGERSEPSAPRLVAESASVLGGVVVGKRPAFGSPLGPTPVDTSASVSEILTTSFEH